MDWAALEKGLYTLLKLFYRSMMFHNALYKRGEVELQALIQVPSRISHPSASFRYDQAQASKNRGDTDQFPLDWSALFGNERPIHLDIGCGKGRLLTDQPLGSDWNYIGIERRLKHVQLIESRIIARCINNARLLWGYAELLLPHLFQNDTADRVSILFPDPWHKGRHRKRRIMAAEIMREIQRILKPGGDFWLVTDHQEYFKTACEAVDDSGLFHSMPGTPPENLTHFEIKYRRQQRPIHSRLFRPRPFGDSL